jgi:coenzyme F420-reducing hydrogenase alpha subunit
MDTGPLPRFNVSAAFWFLLVELFQAAEKFVALCDKEKLVGKSCRTLPAAMGREGFAALESPNGLIFHHYKVDEKGLLQTIDVLDPVAENNALRCILTQKAADAAIGMNLTTQEMKSTIERVLLPI